jgi:glycosyltransferase involved in cell wall biosynthesis
MKVLYQTYSLAHQNPGGGERVIAHLCTELRNLGVDITLRDPWQHHPKDFDLLHYFSLVESAHFPYFRSSCPGLKIVVTPTFFHPASTSRWMRWKEAVGGHLGIFENKRIRDVRSVDHFLPNTRREAQDLQNFFSIPQDQITVIPNGISPVFGQVSGQMFREFAKIDGDFVLHVGRFDPVKNQEFLIRALGAQELQCVFIGNPDPFSGEYFRYCRELASKSTRAKFYFFQNIQPDSELLASAMRAAKVFALPSNFETFGIAALEAQVSGCKLVLSTGFSERDVFTGARFLPLTESRWAENILRELNSPASSVGGNSNAYSWREIAKQVHAEYQRILKR